MNFRKPEILTQLGSWCDRHPEQVWASVGISAVSLFGVVAAFATAPDTSQLSVTQRTVIEQLALPAAVVPETPLAYVHQERIQRGDTIASLMARLGVVDGEAVGFLRTSRDAALINRQMRPGKTVTARTGANGEFYSLAFPLNGGEKELVVEKVAGSYRVREQLQPTETRVVMKSGEIRSSLFAATDAVGLPDAAAIQMADIFGGDVDFHSDLRKGDRFSIVYEMVYSRGEPVKVGRILAAEFINAGHSYKALLFNQSNDSKDKGDYYGPDGKPLRKAFLRSPLEFSRVTSGFTSARFHPILQSWRAHKGVDFGAPTGTGVRATADGSVEFVGRQGGYGNFVVIKHQGSFSTAYGHLKGFAAGLHKGAHVRQGEIIGYVGSTGWATGPHLHYEFRISGNQVNPMTVALPSAVPLNKDQMVAFRQASALFYAQLDQIRGLNLAQAN